MYEIGLMSTQIWLFVIETIVDHDREGLLFLESSINVEIFQKMSQFFFLFFFFGFLGVKK